MPEMAWFILSLNVQENSHKLVVDNLLVVPDVEMLAAANSSKYLGHGLGTVQNIWLKKLDAIRG